MEWEIGKEGVGLKDIRGGGLRAQSEVWVGQYWTSIVIILIVGAILATGNDARFLLGSRSVSLLALVRELKSCSTKIPKVVSASQERIHQSPMGSI